MTSVLQTETIQIANNEIIIRLMSDERNRVTITWATVINGTESIAMEPQPVKIASLPTVVAVCNRLGIVAAQMDAVQSALAAVKANPAYVAYHAAVDAGIARNQAYAARYKFIESRR